MLVSTPDKTIMTLLKFIQETLPELARSIQDPSCDHILIATRQGRWHTLKHGSWQRHPHDLPTEALSILTQMCAATTGDDNLVKPFEVQQLSPDTIALARRVFARHLTLPPNLEEHLQKGLIQGANALIFGPPSAPKEELLERIAAHIPGEPAIFLTSRELSNPPANHITLNLPIDAPQRALQIQQTLRLASAVFWETIPSLDHLARLFSSQPGVQKRWCTFDTFDPEAALLAISHTQAFDALDLLVWVEPHYHPNVPPVLLFKQDAAWSTRSESMLANHLLECANRLLVRQPAVVEPRAKATAPPRQSELETPSTNSYGDLRVTADISDLKLPDPAQLSAKEVDQQSFSSLLQTHVSPENHLLSTHPGFGSRTRQEQEEHDERASTPQRISPQDEDVTEAIPLDRIQMLSSMASSQGSHTKPSMDALPVEALPPDLAREHTKDHEPPRPSSDEPLTLEQPSDPLLLDDLVDEDPILIDDADLDDLPDLDLLPDADPLDELPHDPLAVTSAYTPHVERPQDPFANLDGSSRHPRILDELADDEEEHTESAPAPYDELKRMERELMTASHDETTGIHPDFLDASPPTALGQEDEMEDLIATSIKGASQISIPDDPEVFSSISHSHEERPRRPEAPAGLWQPEHNANEPTQMLDLFDEQEEPPALSWGDDEHTKQRNQDDTSQSSSTETSTSTKLSTLSDRIKALRERQRHGDS